MAMSPMMQEYCKTKEKYKDCVLFYRLGDFYEMFFDDALLASKNWNSHLPERTADWKNVHRCAGFRFMHPKCISNA